MLLIEAIKNLESFPDDFTIYAQRTKGKWRTNSLCTVQEPFPDHSIRQNINGVEMEYVLEVELAKDVVRQWRSHKGLPDLPPYEVFEIIIHYAEFDDFPRTL